MKKSSRLGSRTTLSAKATDVNLLSGNDRIVFDIKGNKYRIIVLVFFTGQKVFIRFVGTHAEYDKVDAKNVSEKVNSVIVS